MDLDPSKLPRVVRALVESGWHVVAEGKVFRQPGQSSVSVSSGVDWFELHGAIEYGDTTAQLPQLLAALKRGETMVTLGDGSYGLLPEEWLRRFGPVAAMGEAEGDHIRFRPSQAGVLDALLATQPAVDCDEAFRRVRQELAQFQSIERGRTARRVSWGSCATTSAKGWAGCTFCANSLSADAWPTTWAWARPRRCWRCWRRAANCARQGRSMRRRWWWFRDR